MSSNPGRKLQTAARRSPADAPPLVYRDPTSPRSPFSDEDDYVVVSEVDESAAFRPSLGSSSEHRGYSEDAGPRFSQDPLLPHPEQYARYGAVAETRPDQRPMLTLNELDPASRAALVRQTRKLHKILGTAPHIAEEQTFKTTPNRLQRRGTLAGSDIRLDRSASMAAANSPSLEPPPGSQWGKPSSSLVATLPSASNANANANVPFLKLNVAAGSPPASARPRRLSDSSIASSFLSMNTPATGALGGRNRSAFEEQQVEALSRQRSGEASRQDTGLYIPPSPTSPPYVSESAKRQQTRARMAKLQQIMGEPVPSELVIGTRDNTHKRRLSMESPTTPSSAVTKALKHKRSKSLWRKDDSAGFDSAPEYSIGGKNHSKSKSSDMPPIEDLLLRQLQNPMSDKQKALNVKRALKMAAVFGVPPPPALYRDAPMPSPKPSGSLDASASASRQSLASLAWMLDNDRDSLYDLLASAGDSDSDADEDPVEWPYEHKGPERKPKPRVDSLPEARRNAKAAVGAAKYTIAGNYPSMAPPTPPFMNHAPTPSRSGDPSTRTQSTKAGQPNPTLPTYVKTVSTSAAEGSGNRLKRQPSNPGAPLAHEKQFMERRRRANKLSRFFGVGYNDLFNTLVYEEDQQDATEKPSNAPPAAPPIPPKVQSERSRNNSSAPSAYRGAGKTGAVMVETEGGKATVLRTSSNVAADVDLTDINAVMSKLRSLKA